MSFPFDATLKEIVREHAADYAAAFGLPRDQPTTVLNVDLSTLSAATDVALGFGDPVQEIVDLNFQSGHDAYLASRVLLYRAAFHYRYHVPIRSLILLLRPAADHAHLTGQLHFGSGPNRVESHYEVIRLWQEPVERLLHGGLGTLPLAPLCKLPEGVPLEDSLTQIVGEIDRRLRQEANYAEGSKLLTASFILTGLRVQRESLAQIYRGVGVMQESSGYQLILEEGEIKGKIKECRNILLRQGRKRFKKKPSASLEKALRSINDLDRLER